MLSDNDCDYHYRNYYTTITGKMKIEKSFYSPKIVPPVTFSLGRRAGECSVFGAYSTVQYRVMQSIEQSKARGSTN